MKVMSEMLYMTAHGDFYDNIEDVVFSIVLYSDGQAKLVRNSDQSDTPGFVDELALSLILHESVYLGRVR